MLGINLNRSKFDVPQPTNPIEKPQIKMNTLSRDTVSFKSMALAPSNAFELVSNASKELKGTCAAAYLDILGENIKCSTSTLRRKADTHSQMVELKLVPQIEEIHKRLLADPSVKNIVKDGIRLTFDRKLASDYR